MGKPGAYSSADDSRLRMDRLIQARRMASWHAAGTLPVDKGTHDAS